MNKTPPHISIVMTAALAATPAHAAEARANLDTVLEARETNDERIDETVISAELPVTAAENLAINNVIATRLNLGVLGHRSLTSLSAPKDARNETPEISAIVALPPPIAEDELNHKITTPWSLQAMVDAQPTTGSPFLPSTAAPPGLNNAFAVLQRETDQTCFEIAVQGGPVAVQTITSSPGAEFFQYVPRLNAGFKLNGISVIAGEQAFPGGWGSDLRYRDLASSTNYTLGYHQESLPYRVPGLRIKTPLTSEHSLDFWFIEGGQLVDGKRAQLAAIFGHTWRPTPDFSVESYALMGSKRGAEGSLEAGRAIFETKVTKKISRFNVGGLMNIGMDPNPETIRTVPHWVTAGLLVEGQVLPRENRWRNALRVEMVHDPNKSALPTREGENFFNATYTNNVWLSQNWLMGIENRLDVIDRYGVDYRFIFSLAALLNHPFTKRKSL